MIYIIGLIFTIMGIISVKTFIKKNKVIYYVGIVIIILSSIIGICCLQYWSEKNKFKSFNLDELKKQELIIQTIHFKKFIVTGTDIPKTTETSKYTDEVHVYFVSGHADISFTDIDNLKIDEVASDIMTGTLRLNYINPKNKLPFSIDVKINEDDFYKVTSYESEPIKIGTYKKDLIKPEISQSEKITLVKAELEKEFEEQILNDTNPKKLNESDLYQVFIKRLTEIITGLSSWKSVEINFVKGN